MLSIPLVGGHDKLDFITLDEDVAALNFSHVEEQLLALLHLIVNTSYTINYFSQSLAFFITKLN